jgi:hypothetical protein
MRAPLPSVHDFGCSIRQSATQAEVDVPGRIVGNSYPWDYFRMARDPGPKGQEVVLEVGLSSGFSVDGGRDPAVRQSYNPELTLKYHLPAEEIIASSDFLEPSSECSPDPVSG